MRCSSRELEQVILHSVQPASSSILRGALGEVGHIAGVEPYAALGYPQRLEHLIEGADGVRHSAAEGVVGIHEQGGVLG